VWEWAVAGLCLPAVTVLTEIVIVVPHLVVGIAVVIVAGHPMEGGMHQQKNGKLKYIAFFTGET